MLLNTRTYSVDRLLPDATVYKGPAHTFSARDTFELKRVYPKPTSVFAGVARPTAKLTKAVVVNSVTGAKSDAIVTLSGSIPVGTSDADIDGLLADIAAWAASADAKAHFKQLDISA